MRFKLILPSLTDAAGMRKRGVKYFRFPPLGLAALAAYLRPDDQVDMQDEHVETLNIEDEPDVVESIELGFALQWREIELIGAGSGEAGLDAIERERPDMVLLDVGLPDISGFEVLRRIRDFSDVDAEPASIERARRELAAEIVAAEHEPFVMWETRPAEWSGLKTAGAC